MAHSAQMAARARKEAATGKKPGGKPPKPPEAGPRADDQINLTDEASRIMKVAGGGFDQCFNAQALVDTESMLILVAHVSQDTNDKQQVAPMVDKMQANPEGLNQTGHPAGGYRIFLQSKMHQNGVTCMDCHEPHSLKLRAEANALCTRCHNAAEFDDQKHHRHVAGGKGAQCVTCHMPTQNYMVIHARQDHSLRIPRPDLSQSLGSPNACTQCHANKKPAWAASAMDKWYGKAWRERPHYGPTLHAGETRGALALPGLLELAASPTAPAIVRATAATLAQPYASPGTLPAARALLQDADPSLRIAALGLLAPLDIPDRVAGAAPLLSDPVRGVRIEAAQILADVPDNELPPGSRLARQNALQEYEAMLARESDWPATNVNLGNLRLRQGRADEAVAAYERAIRLDPRFVGAYVNLADAWRQQEREPQAEKVLRQGLAVLPRDAELHYALGLVLVRRHENDAALGEFVEAARLAPDNARYAYVRAIALHSAGKRAEALAVLRGANRRHPDDLDILGALISISREAGDRPAALRYAKRAAVLLPDNADLKRLVAELEGR